MRTIQRPQQLLRLLFHLLFLFGDVGYDVAENIERRNSRVSRAADRLHGNRHHRLESERAMQWSQRQHQSNGRAVGVGNRKPPGLAPPGLGIDQLNMIAIDFGNHQRNVGLHPQRARIGDHRTTGVGEPWLQFAGDRSIERGENNLWRTFGLGRRNRHLGDVGRDGRL